jgi:hypothetical protein
LALKDAVLDDDFERGAWNEGAVTERVDVAKGLVAGDEPVVGIPQNEAARHGFDDLVEQRTRRSLLSQYFDERYRKRRNR